MKLALAPLVRAVVGVLLVAASARAGSTTASLHGTVKDPDGAPVPDVAIEIVLQDMGTKMTLKSDSKGKFAQVGVRPGTWLITVRKPGFLEVSQPIQLTLGNRTPVDVVLAPLAAPREAAAPAEKAYALGDMKLSKEAGEAYQTAQDALEAKDTPKAREALSAFIAMEPTVSGPYFVLAQLEREAGEKARAAELLQKGLELKPDDVFGWVALGEIQSDQGDLDVAVTTFRKAVEVAPDDPLPHRKLAMAFLMKQDYAGAQSELETYLRLAPEAPDAAEKKALLEEVRKVGAKAAAKAAAKTAK